MTLLSGIFASTPINRTDLPQELLDIEDKQRSNPLPWKGQFSPQLIEALLTTYAGKDSIIFDPFLGSGTILYEAGRFGLEAYGTEINPAAFILSDVYKFLNVPMEEREKLLDAFMRTIESEVPETSPLFQGNSLAANSKVVEKKIIELVQQYEGEPIGSLYKAWVVLIDFHKDNVTRTKALAIGKVLYNFVKKLPFSDSPIAVFNSDARKVPLRDSVVDLAITSPPYINVFNYHQQYRASAEALDWKLLEVAKSEFGSNRKHRGNRFLTVIQYCLDMASALQELLRVCKPKGRMIFVVGRESNVRGTPFLNGELVTEVANRTLGLSLELRQERVFTNRYGQKIKEDILHLSNENRNIPVLDFEEARLVAIEALSAALPVAADKVKANIEDAIEKAGQVEPSPLYDQWRAQEQAIKQVEKAYV